MDRSERRKRRRRARANRIRVIVFVAILALVGVVGLSVKNVLDLSLEQNRLKKENSELKEKRAALERELASLNDNDYIEEQARKQLNMVKPGEIVYIIDDDEDDK